MHVTMDTLVLQHERVRFSSRAHPLESLDASAVFCGRVQSELRLRPSKMWMRPASAVDALEIFGKRVQMRPWCVHHFCERVQGGTYV